MVSVHPARRCTSLLLVVQVGLGDGVGDCHDVANLPRVRLFVSLLYLFGENKLYSFSKSMVSGFSVPLGMLVAKWKPTPCFHDAYSVSTPNRTFRVKGWQKHCKTMVPSFWDVPFWQA